MVRAMLRFALVCSSLLVVAGCRNKGTPITPCLEFGDGGVTTCTIADGVPHFVPPTSPVTSSGACGAAPATPDGGTSPAVTLAGFVRPYLTGAADRFSISVYDAAQLSNGADPTSQVPLGQTNQAFSDPRVDCSVDGRIGCVLLRAQCPQGSCSPTDMGDNPLSDCRNVGGGVGDCIDHLSSDLGFEIPNLPADRPLVIRVSSAGGANSRQWVTTIEWNVTLSSSAPACAPNTSATDCNDQTNHRYLHNVVIVATSDWAQLPAAAGLTGGVRAGEGIILGRVTDGCTGLVMGAQVAITPAADRFRSQDGTFSAFGVPAGKVTIEVAGAAPVGGGLMLTLLRRADIAAYANTVVLLNL
jgi:hypothetical protein